MDPQEFFRTRMSKSPTEVVLRTHGKNTEDYLEVYLTAAYQTKLISNKNPLEELAEAAIELGCEYVSEVSCDGIVTKLIGSSLLIYSGMGLIPKNQKEE